MKQLSFVFIIALLFLISCKKNSGGGDNILVITKDTNNLVKLTESDYRPLFHFSPARNWMNDPNGLVFYRGTFHLFYQYNPNANVWGPMNWGHATSNDLYKWQDQSIALTPDNLGTIFSGSAVVDSSNTSGFKNGNDAPIVAIFTHSGTQQMQSLAYSADGGISWNKYASNPVIANPGLTDFRDPKVFWYGAQQKWILVLAAGDRVKIYSSPNLKDWNFESDFGVNVGAHGGVWECPDLFQLAVEGTSTTKWVLLVSLNGGPNGGTATQYFVGDFDGKNFTTSSNTVSWIDYGTDNYAGSTYNNIPASDGRRIFIGWMSNWAYAQQVPTTTWRSTMTIPRVLSLSAQASDYILKSNPAAAELANYETGTPDTSISGAVKSLSITNNKIIKSGTYEIDFSADLSLTNSLQLTLGSPVERVLINYDKSSNVLSLDRSASGQVNFNAQFSQKILCPFTPLSGQLTNFQIVVDKTSLELFADHGNKVISILFFPNYQYNLLKLSGDNTGAVISNFKLKGISQSLFR